MNYISSAKTNKDEMFFYCCLHADQPIITSQDAAENIINVQLAPLERRMNLVYCVALHIKKIKMHMRLD
jgi:hypothetical protein